ncbi:MAG: YqgE/AlgH family protein [Bacteroidota bacterium]|nr:YqgE/AlgH family protein [Bacteroidota bacterium]
MIDPVAGTLLISDPFLKDPNFLRTVVILCDHQYEGSFGFVLNKLYDQKIGELVPDLEGIDFPVYYGGPVQTNTLHFLHQHPELIDGGILVTDNVYWGGDFETVIELLKENRLKQNDIRFYIGYSGWGEGQLEEELKAKSWITSQGTSKLIFHRNADMIWKDALRNLGGEYAQMINYPIDPQLN